MRNLFVKIVVCLASIVICVARPTPQYKVIQGDILIPVHSVHFFQSEKFDTKPWPNAQVYYKLDKSYGEKEKTIIKEAMRKIEDISCVRFFDTKDDKYYLHIVNANGCQSTLGWMQEEMRTYLKSDKCFKSSRTSLHEMFHVLGFSHEHNRPDRDEYITIDWDDIERDIKKRKVHKDQKNQFVKQRVFIPRMVQKFEYDYFSINHYAFYITPKNELVTKNQILKKNQQAELSSTDIMKINRFYNC